MMVGTHEKSAAGFNWLRFLLCFFGGIPIQID